MTDNERKLAITASSLLVAAGTLYFGLRPILAEYHDVQLARGARKLEIAELNVRQQTLQALGQQIEAKKADVERLLLAVPADEAYPELLTTLNAIAGRSSVVLVSIQPTRGGATTSGTVPLAISLSGSYPQILSFVSDVEKNLRPVTIQSLNMVEGMSGGGVLTATMQMEFARITSGGAQ